jgi:putative DNA primase/helicase
VGEGWTTVKTVMDATGLPGWSVFGVSGLASFDPPDSVKQVLLLAENDESGANAKALEAICPRLFERGLKIGVAHPPPGLNDFNDLVGMRDDGTRLHGTVEAGLKVVKDIVEGAKARATSKADSATAPSGAAPPVVDLPGLDGDDDWKFVMTPHGLYRGKMFICSPFEVVAHTHALLDGEADDWGLQLRFPDKRGVVVEKFLSAESLYGEPSAAATGLARAGMRDVVNTAKAKAALAAYLGLVKAEAFTVVAKRTGWTEANGELVFVLPGQVFGAKRARVALAQEGKRLVVYRQAGTLAEWQEHIGKSAGDHLLMQFGIAIGWAGALLEMAGGESGGFHIHEVSTRGKTTVQQTGASLWGKGTLTGGFIQRWRSTANNLEAVFASASDTCLILDELKQAAYGEVASIIYTLTGETGKGRLRADASARTPYTWRVLLLSSGETPIAHRLKEDRYQRGGQSKELLGGATVRMIDIPADRAFGAFDQPPHIPNFNPAAFAEHMQEMAATYYGVAGPAFVKALLEEKVDSETLRRAVDEFVASVTEPGAAGQLRRVARRFGLVATAGLMAIGAGIVDWDPDRFVAGVRGLFGAWSKAHGSGPIEEALLLERVRDFFAAFGESHFDSADEAPDLHSLKDRPVADRAGYRTGYGGSRTWYMLVPALRKLVAPVDLQKAAEILHKHGMLEKGHEADGRFEKRAPRSVGQPRAFVITAKVIEGSGDDDAGEKT